MISAVSAITYIEGELKRLKANGKLFGTIHMSKSSLSVYINTKLPTPTPQKSVRSSNHHPNLQNMVTNGHEPWNTTNISIEFFEPIRQANGKIKQNRLRTTVFQNTKGTIQPFDVTVYEYQAKLLDYSDIPIIFNEIISFINTNTFINPLSGTPKEAKVLTRTAKVVSKKTKNSSSSNMSTSQNSAPTFTQTSTQPITESQLRCIIREALISLYS